MRQEPYDSDYFDRRHLLITVFLFGCMQADAIGETQQEYPMYAWSVMICERTIFNCSQMFRDSSCIICSNMHRENICFQTIIILHIETCCSSSAETKLSCIKTELKRCIMNDSFWNKYGISRKIQFKRSPKVVRKERALARTVGFHCDWLKSKNIGGLLRRRQTEQKTTRLRPESRLVR